MEQRLETEDLHSESTDISSSIDADDLLHSGDSSLGEADKQIMEWAGKLELESIDLREKSEKLINTLTNMSQELMKVSSQLVKQLENCNHSKEEDIVDQVYKLDVNINNQLQDWKKSFSDQLKSINHNSNLGQIKNLTECMANQEANILGAIRHNSTILKDECRDIIKSQELAGAPKLQRAVDYLHEIMHNMSCQTESMNESLLSIDKQLHNIDLALIKEKDQYKVQFKAFKRSLRDMITSNRNNVEDTVVNTVQVTIERKLEDMFDKMFDQKLLGKLRLLITKGEIPVPEGSKLANAIPLNRHTNDYDLNGTTWTDSSSQDGPRTRARFRTKNKVTKPRKSEISRTIIPWCEISSPPVEYTSDL